MGLLDFLRGIKRPKEGAAVQPKAELERRLLALNHEQVPFSVKPSQTSDLEAEWKIVDATWYEIFAKAGLEKSHKIYLRLDDGKREARVLEEMWEVGWEAGVPRFSLSMKKQRGRTLGSVEYGNRYAFTGVNPLEFGQAYEYRFNVSEMKEPIEEIITGSGWSYVPVASMRKVKK
jgi:hypothetical protein